MRCPSHAKAFEIATDVTRQRLGRAQCFSAFDAGLDAPGEPALERTKADACDVPHGT